MAFFRLRKTEAGRQRQEKIGFAKTGAKMRSCGERLCGLSETRKIASLKLQVFKWKFLTNPYQHENENSIGIDKSWRKLFLSYLQKQWHERANFATIKRPKRKLFSFYRKKSGPIFHEWSAEPFFWMPNDDSEKLWKTRNGIKVLCGNSFSIFMLRRIDFHVEMTHIWCTHNCSQSFIWKSH